MELMRGITVVPLYTRVQIGGSYHGLVLAICIRDNVTYEVAWFAAGVRYTAWLSEDEFKVVNPLECRSTIGFSKAYEPKDRDHQ